MSVSNNSLEMASYSGLAENINKTNLDNQQILKDLELLKTTVTYLKYHPPNELSDEIKNKIRHLSTSFDILQARLSRNAINSNELEELWEGNEILKFLFQKCIQHNPVSNSLRCMTCDEWLSPSRMYFKNHLGGSRHIHCFVRNLRCHQIYTCNDMVLISNGEMKGLNIDDGICLMLKNDKFIDFEGPNGMVSCKLCCVKINLSCGIDNLEAHLKESLHQELFKEAVNVIVGTTKNNLEKTKNKNIFIYSEPNSLPFMSFNNLYPLVNENNFQLASGLTAIPNHSTNQNRHDMENWFRDTIDKFVIELLEDYSPGNKLYICCICQFHTTLYIRWQEHCFSASHENYMMLGNVLYYPCKCSTEMICPNYIRVYHMNNNHDRLLKLFNALKLEVTLPGNDNVSSDDDNDKNINNYESDSKRKAMSDDLKSYFKFKFSNQVDNSGVKPKIVNSNNVKGGEEKNVTPISPARKIQEKNYISGQNNSISMEYSKNATPIGLSDLPENVSDDELMRAIEHFGNIKKIEKVRPSFANVYIELREEFQSILYLHLTVNIGDSEVRVTDPILQSIPDVKLDDVHFTSKFTPNGKSYSSWSAAHYLQFSKESFQKLVQHLFAKSKRFCKDAESVRVDLQNAISCPVELVGSKALLLAIDDCSALDLFVHIDDNYFGTNTEACAVERRIRRLINALKKSEHFKKVDIATNDAQVLEVIHNKTNIKCQIFSQSGLVVEKTVLSRIYLNCDQNLRCMVMVLLDWFKKTGLRDKLSAYSILWMALFPLIHKKDLYTVATTSIFNEGHRMQVAGWDCRYSTMFSPRRRSFPSVYKLLYEFFQFYSLFDNYDRKVLAPLTGEAFDQELFHHRTLPGPYRQYVLLTELKLVPFLKLTKGVCLQDPLQLNYNLTKPLKGNSLSSFIHYCEATLLNSHPY